MPRKHSVPACRVHRPRRQKRSRFPKAGTSQRCVSTGGDGFTRRSREDRRRRRHHEGDRTLLRNRVSGSPCQGLRARSIALLPIVSLSHLRCNSNPRAQSGPGPLAYSSGLCGSVRRGATTKRNPSGRAIKERRSGSRPPPGSSHSRRWSGTPFALPGPRARPVLRSRRHDAAPPPTAGQSALRDALRFRRR